MIRDSRLHSYVVAWDAGLAPNPYWDYCTLAVCKPQLRRSAVEGDWIVGLSPRQFDKIVYAMKVMGKISFAEYFQDSRFQLKKPDIESGDHRVALGDNFYCLDGRSYIQMPSVHSYYGGRENLEHKRRDLSGEFVLIGTRFHYFGKEGPNLPEDFRFLIVRRGHKNSFTLDERASVLRYLDGFDGGINGDPRDWENGMWRLKNKER